MTALTEAGLSPVALDVRDAKGPGVLFFSEINQKLFELLNQVSNNGLVRVLAVALSSLTLAGGGVWRLLQAGASDAFAWDHSSTPEREVVARLERWVSVDKLLNSPVVKTIWSVRALVGDWYCARSWRSPALATRPF